MAFLQARWDQVAFLLGLRRRGPSGVLATLRLPSRSDLGGCTATCRRLDRPRGLCGQLGALHTTVATGRRTRDWLCGSSTLQDV